MIVMAVVGILSGLVITVINPAQLRARSRDATRIADLKKIQTTLELRFADLRNYPSSPSWQAVSVVLASPLASYYSGALPVDPLSTNNLTFSSCGTNFRYSYRSASGSNYVLVAKMETTAVDYAACSSVSNCITTYGCNCASYCHAVQNPF
ncbi:MAG: hypothetical protein UU90_C0003G0018 [candidate division WWE3 bacterium GW2011_GWD2_42_11]|nr:MAG: hypothetical protein UU90_C0003G0018 [candidate division WWE3 bacterium GW2011_GWD2_42_11]KKS76247.1 MAG: hypothetical protein UV49_C0016G0007 [candidate division WWE3 bacterium GW2011_GWA2_42_9]